MPTPRIVLVYPLPDEGVEAELRSRAEVIVPKGDDASALRSALVGAQGIILRGPAHLTGELIREAATLRAIGAQGSGTDNIDVEAASARSIPVVHGAGVAPVPVAEYVIGAMVAGHRRLLELHRVIARGELEWPQRMAAYRGTQLTGSTLGIVGFGHIGRQVAAMAQAAFGVSVITYDPYLPEEADTGPARRVKDLGELLDRSMTLSVHVPLNQSTRGLLGRDELRRLGPEGVLVDAARGGVVDEAGLVAALQARELKAAVVDVFDGEPLAREQALRLGRVPGLLLTPHVAGITDQGLSALSRNVVDGVLGALEGRQVAPVVNPGVYRVG